MVVEVEGELLLVEVQLVQQGQEEEEEVVEVGELECHMVYFLSS